MLLRRSFDLMSFQDYESQAAEHLPIYDRTRHIGRSLLTQCGSADVSSLASKLDLIEKRWKNLLLELQKSKTSEKKPRTGEQLRDDMLQLRAWFMEAETLLTINPPPENIQQGFEKVSKQVIPFNRILGQGFRAIMPETTELT